MLPSAMNKSSLLLVSTLCLFAACKGNAYRLNVGPMFAVANGDIALQNAAGTLSLGDNQNDIDVVRAFYQRVVLPAAKK